MPIYAGVSGANRQVMKVPVGVSGTNRECKSVYAGVSGTNRQVFSASNCSIKVTALEEDGKEGKYTINSDKSITFTVGEKTTEKGNNGGYGIRIGINLDVPQSVGEHSLLVNFQSPSYKNNNANLVLSHSINGGDSSSKYFSTAVKDLKIGPVTIERSTATDSFSFNIKGFGSRNGEFTATIPVGGILVDGVPMIPA